MKESVLQAEIKTAVERSHHLAWWQYLLIFIIVQALVLLIYKQSSPLFSRMKSSNSGTMRASGLSRLFSNLPSFTQPNDSPRSKDMNKQ